MCWIDYRPCWSPRACAAWCCTAGGTALAALIGALYAALMVLPGFGWLANGMMKLALGAAMALIAFGGEAHLVRCTVVFFAVSAAFGGAVYAASMLAGVSPGSGALVTVSGRVLALSFAVCYAAVSLVSPPAGQGRRPRCAP
ncbi:MAG: sigma-E processing peptidase SpoIIGA [Oscillospiraceae bacterium]